MLDWIDKNKLFNERLSFNQCAVYYLEDNPDLINWSYMSRNPSGIEILKNNKHKINWSWITSNENAKDIIESYIEPLYYFEKKSIIKNSCMIDFIEKYYLNFDFSDKCDLLQNKKSSQIFENNISDLHNIMSYLQDNNTFHCNYITDITTIKYCKKYETSLKDVYCQLCTDQLFIENNISKFPDKFQKNPNAIKFLWQYKDYNYSLEQLIHNKNAGQLIEYIVEKNKNDQELFKNNISMISSHAGVIEYLEKNKDLINYYNLSLNESIFTYDYNLIKEERQVINSLITSQFL